ncbi:uncharacterized protein F5147DRAFT_685814 [Suillus discolor]|uniref:Uncharacterized protein n=1 Tax=Suillus discolor TaxID=1912936 RepID=A0A9P7FCA0_9AGAM|nr:uncharacterized protein F5147DRAFT_685814 [Suillus discolor]KAG2111570.1 hypothetical protein F5147DRAFT_685814 [Suillus discolor]
MAMLGRIRFRLLATRRLTRHHLPGWRYMNMDSTSLLLIHLTWARTLPACLLKTFPRALNPLNKIPGQLLWTTMPVFL